MKANNWTLENIPDLSSKTIIVTGGNSGLGFESAKAFASKGAEVIIACRSKEKGEEAKDEIIKHTPYAKLKVMELDLMDNESVRMFASKFRSSHTQLNVLLNNAGIMMSPYQLTTDGFEHQMSTNYLGHFVLTALLMEILAKTPESRVVNVSSLAHKRGKMDFNNLLYQNIDGYSPFNAYARSKLSNLLFTYELQRYFELKAIDSIAMAAHPGVSQTELGRNIDKKLFFRILGPLLKVLVPSAEKGSLPQIRASTDPNVKGGEYYGPGGFMEMSGYPVLVKSNNNAHIEENAKKLWEENEKLTGIRY